MDFLLELILPLLELLYLPLDARPTNGRRAAKRAEITTILSHSVMILCQKVPPSLQRDLFCRRLGVCRRVGPAGLLAMTTVFCHSEERSEVGIRPFTMDEGWGSGRRT